MLGIRWRVDMIIGDLSVMAIGNRAKAIEEEGVTW